jgi:Na+-translocating ferredoxin:NAD+ oxidoreductase subunit A
MSWVGMLLTFSLVQNVVLVQLLGVCPCVGAPRRLATALGIGIASTAVMSVASLAGWAISTLVLVPLGVPWLQTVVFVLLSAGIGWLFEAAAARAAPALLRATGFAARGIAANCAVLGVALLAARAGSWPGGARGPLEALAAGLFSGLGMLLVLVLLSGIRARLDCERVPAALRGVPLSLVTAGLLALAFAAFDRQLVARLLPALGLAP